MKKVTVVLLFIFGTVAGMAVVLSGVLLYNTFIFSSSQLRVQPVRHIKIDRDPAFERLGEAIRFKTISYDEPELFDGEEFLAFHDYLEETYPVFHEVLEKEVVNEYSLLYKWEGREGWQEGEDILKPVLLTGHLDVVPVSEETEEDWVYPPFEGLRRDGYIWGRGTLDDKFQVLALMEAVEILIGEGFRPRRTFYFAFGHDEEIGGMEGAAKISALLQSREIEFEYVLDEGGMVVTEAMPGIEAPVALVGIAEKGAVNIELTVKMEEGHSSSPPPSTAIGIISTAIHNIEQNPFPARIVEPVRKMAEFAGPELGFINRLAFANLPILEGVIKWQLASEPHTNASVRTTAAATIFEGGYKANILPPEARAVVNFRILHGDTVEDVVNHVRNVVDDPRVKIRVIGNSADPGATSDVRAESFHVLGVTIGQMFPGTIVSPYLVLGMTDARHYEPLSENVYRFSPVTVTPEYLETIHGVNERISVNSYEECIVFYRQLIRNTSTTYERFFPSEEEEEEG